jgi:hypothetical protein
MNKKKLSCGCDCVEKHNSLFIINVVCDFHKKESLKKVINGVNY